MTPKRMLVRRDDVINGNLWKCFPVINVDKTKDIPCDYPGAMGVPITFLDKYDSELFEILDCPSHIRTVDGREPYRRVIIRHRHPKLPEYIDLAEWFLRMGIPLDVQFVGSADDLPEDATIIYRWSPEPVTT